MPIWLWQLIVSGLATTASAAALLTLYNLWRNWRLKTTITKAIQTKSHHWGTKGDGWKYLNAGIVIYNPFESPFTVRAVWAESVHKDGKQRCPLYYAGVYYQEDIVPVDFPDKENPYRFIQLNAFTNGQLSLNAFDPNPKKKHDHFNRICVHVEFMTFFRSPKVIKVFIENSKILFMLNEMIDEINENKLQKTAI